MIAEINIFNVTPAKNFKTREFAYYVDEYVSWLALQWGFCISDSSSDDLSHSIQNWYQIGLRRNESLRYTMYSFP